MINKLKRCFFLSGIFFLSLGPSAIAAQSDDNKRITRSEYIERYKNEAIKEMQRSGVPASITLAQGILESGDGNSLLAKNANNHFGIKCHSDWEGKTFHKDDDAKNECFRKYNSVLESYHDHSEFLKKKRYAALFELDITDYKAWAKGLKDAGYATNPKYPELLIGIIEQNELYQFDQLGLKIFASKTKKTKSSDSNKNSSKVGKIGTLKIKTHLNNIKYIELEPGYSLESLADELNMAPWQFRKYNDLEKEESLKSEGTLFLQPKRNKAKENYHIVENGETMWDISQKHGIKLTKLLKKNRMKQGEEAKVGQKLSLRKKVPLN